MYAPVFANFARCTPYFARAPRAQRAQRLRARAAGKNESFISRELDFSSLFHPFFTAMHLIEVGAHVHRDPRFRPVGWRRWASPPRSRRRLLPLPPTPPPAPPPPPPPPPRPPPPLDHRFLQGEYVHE